MENFWHWLKMSFNMHIRWIRVPLGQLATAKLYKAKSNLKAKIIWRWILPFHEQLEKPLFLGRTMKHTGHVSCFWKCAKSISHCDVQVSKVRKNDKDGTCARLHLLSAFTETSTTCAWSLTNPAGTMRLQMTHLWLPKLMSILAEATRDASWDTSQVVTNSCWWIAMEDPKGLLQLLKKWRVSTHKMVQEDMDACLEQFDNFKYELSAVTSYLIRDLKYHCIFLVHFDTQLLH